MAVMNFGGVDENVVTREEFPLEKAREVLKDEVIAVIGYGVAKQNDILVERFDLSLQFDTVHQIDGNRDTSLTKTV